MRLGVVGSRDYPDLLAVAAYIHALPLDTVIVSGGARGVDKTAADTARARGMEVVEHFPDLEGATKRGALTARYYARNLKIVDDSDKVVAFTQKTTGGTWNTIAHAIRAGKAVAIIPPKWRKS